MKKLQITLFAILFATACSKDKDGSNENYRVKQTVYNNSSTTDTYENNNQNQITRINHSGGTFERAVYNLTGKLASYEVGGNPTLHHNYIQSYIYNPAGIVQEQITTYGDGEKYKFVYTIANGLQTGYKTYSWKGGAWSENTSSAVTYSYNGANQLIKIQNENYYNLYAYDERGNRNSNKNYQMKSDNSGFYLSKVVLYTFDNKKSIDVSIIKSTFSKNNYLEFVDTNYGENGMINSQSTTTFSYEYNAAGYVTKFFHGGVLYATYTLEKI
jgi:hypothetical protein